MTQSESLRSKKNFKMPTLHFFKPSPYGLINSRSAHPPPPGICRGFFSLLLPNGGVFAEGQPGAGALPKTIRPFGLKTELAYGANNCIIVPTCEREMTERRTCTGRERVAVLAVKKRFELSQILQKHIYLSAIIASICTRKLSPPQF